MKQKILRLSQRYVTALGIHLKDGGATTLQSALKLGCQAAALGVAILDLARMHERAIVTLQLSEDKNGICKRAEVFFHEALTPIVEKHQGAWQSKSDLNRLDDTMDQRTRQLAASNRQLRQDIIRIENREAALRKSIRNYTKLLKESLQLQNGLRQLTHKVLDAQEDERKKISHELQDEIAQTLLGINVRLLLLKRESHGNTKGLKNEIASTQRLVVSTAKSVRRVACEVRNA